MMSASFQDFENDVYEVILTDEILQLPEGQYAFVFTLMNVKNPFCEAKIFFNVEKNNKNKHYKVSKHSKFARLYRLSFGKNPQNRYSKAEQLRSHFAGLQFKCKTKQSKYRKGDTYLKVTEMHPINPILSDDWTPTGILKTKNRSTNESRPKKSDTHVHPINLDSDEEMQRVIDNTFYLY
jgi:hypothetical protein